MRQDAATSLLTLLRRQIKARLQAFRRIMVGLARGAYHKVNTTRWGSFIGSSRHYGWLRNKFIVMRGTDVHTVMDALRTAGVEAWIVGGWGVDALLGVGTRRHGDLDVIVEADPEMVERAVQALGAVGFRLAAETDGGVWLPHRHILDDGAGHIVEILPADLSREPFTSAASRKDGSGTPARPFAASGIIAGWPVACVSADVQIVLHGGYQAREVDKRDLYKLQAARNRPVD
jgi:lincosamide nucleotidyltransferase A/C/D/E